MSYDGEYDASEYPDGINAPRLGWRGSREMAELRASKDAEIDRLRGLLCDIRDWFDHPDGEPSSSDLLDKINEALA